MGKLTHTVKGPIASFRSADKADIESLKLHFLPKQEGSGDPSPTNIRPITGWNGCNGRRSGKNLMPKDIVAGTEHSQGLTFVQNADGSIRITGTANNTVTKLAVIKNYANGSFPLKAGTYRPHMWSTDTTKNQIYISIMYNDGANSMYCNAGGSSYTYTLTEDVYVNQIRIGLTASEDVEFDLTIYPSLEKGSTPTSWEPCRGELIPITFPSNGKNIVDWVTPDGFSANVDFFNGWNANWISGPFRVDKSYVGKILTYSADIDNTAASRTAFLHVWTQDKNNNYVRIDIQSEVVDVGESKRVAVSMIVDDKWYDIYFGLSIGRGCAVSHPMVEWGDAATSYEPYTANNTFYGGYIDPVAGEIVAEYAFKVCDGSETWNTTATSGSNVRFHVTPGNLGLPKPINSSTSFAKFNYFKPSSTSASWTGFIGSTGNVLFYVPKTVAEDASQWKEYLSEHNLQICYKLEEPIHIPVAPQDLKAFLDHNNFWSDMNDDTEVEYCFADRLLTERKRIMHARNEGQLIFWLSGDDAPVDGKWIDRIGGLDFTLMDDASYDSINKIYDFDNWGYAYRRINIDPINMGHHFRIEYDILYKRQGSGMFIDLGSLTRADKAIGFGMASKTSDLISYNWKMNGNNSNPWSASSEQRTHPNSPPIDENYHDCKGFFETIDGGDGYDRFRMKLNGKIVKYYTQVPKVLYAGPWISDQLYFSIGTGVYNVGKASESRDATYRCFSKIRSIKIYRYD